MNILPIKDAHITLATLRTLHKLIHNELVRQGEPVPGCPCNEEEEDKDKGELIDMHDTEIQRAVTLIKDVLTDGPKPMLAVIEHGLQAGISRRTMLRAKEERGVAASLRRDKVWYWELKA